MKTIKVIRPQADYILLQRVDVKSEMVQNAAGLYVPSKSSVADSPSFGVVLAIGPEVTLVEPGDQVVFDRNGKHPIVKFQGIEQVLLPERGVLGKIEEIEAEDDGNDTDDGNDVGEFEDTGCMVLPARRPFTEFRAELIEEARRATGARGPGELTRLRAELPEEARRAIAAGGHAPWGVGTDADNADGPIYGAVDGEDDNELLFDEDGLLLASEGAEPIDPDDVGDLVVEDGDTNAFAAEFDDETGEEGAAA